MHYRLKEHIAISGTGVLFNTQTGESFTVNEMGMMIIDLIRKNKDYDEIKDAIFSEYLIDEGSLEHHLEDFLGYMKQHHLVELKPTH
jgi:hypothetical protein